MSDVEFLHVKQNIPLIIFCTLTWSVRLSIEYEELFKNNFLLCRLELMITLTASQQRTKATMSTIRKNLAWKDVFERSARSSALSASGIASSWYRLLLVFFSIFHKTQIQWIYGILNNVNVKQTSCTIWPQLPISVFFKEKSSCSNKTLFENRILTKTFLIIFGGTVQI